MQSSRESKIEFIFWVPGRPTEIEECDVYVVESKVLGREFGKNRCNLIGSKTLASSKHTETTPRDGGEPSASTNLEGVHSDIPSTSKSVAEQHYRQPDIPTDQTSISTSSSASLDEEFSNPTTSAAADARNTQIADNEEPMNDAFAKKLKQPLKVGVETCQA